VGELFDPLAKLPESDHEIRTLGRFIDRCCRFLRCCVIEASRIKRCTFSMGCHLAFPGHVRCVPLLGQSLSSISASGTEGKRFQEALFTAVSTFNECTLIERILLER
jgi:hypothetical protein